MEEIKKFIEDYICIENKCLKTKWDVEKTDDEVSELNTGMQLYFHSIAKNSLERTGYEFTDDDDIIYAKKKYEKIVPRTLFQIKQYKNPEVGEGLARWLITDELFACYTSYTENNGLPLDYATVFYAAQTNEGLKIIYKIRYESDVPEWRHSHDLKINQVKNPGKLIAVEKYQAPEETNSLVDYNAE
ncbi:hypothetical protein [Flavobacterium sp. CAU 1735]|uniref:hypothetical protein n=1 Tax=Flavobacterium sp. CAU 1735 TaxID=3140361 RepID=UPI003260F950